jgi:hypothetical protein
MMTKTMEINNVKMDSRITNIEKKAILKDKYL